MKPEYTAVIFKDGGWYVGWCPEIKGANGQGKTRKECLEDFEGFGGNDLPGTSYSASA